ncbi:MAG TPA: fasciclin domain-containing protein, partial [Myxococcota bacterium]|nr:fasciclin domain-containing protein [Myxococcota bacterium]
NLRALSSAITALTPTAARHQRTIARYRGERGPWCALTIKNDETLHGAARKDMSMNQTSNNDTAKKDIIETAATAGNFNTLAKALGNADLVATLKGAGPFTVFAPTDQAFEKIPKADLEALMQDKNKLKDVLLHHVITGKVMAADVGKMQDGAKVATVGGRDFVLGRNNGNITVDKALLTKFDISASNGVIHVLDTVILPS